MNKKDIKIMLRESIDKFIKMNEAKGKSTKGNKKDDGDDDDDKSKQNTGGKKDYSDVKRSFEKLGGPSMVDVMQLTGISDDEKGVNRSLFRKKVKQIKNKDTGSYYQFSDEELNQVRSALNIEK